MVALVYCTDKYYFKISDNFNAQNIDQSYFICEAREFAVSKVRLDLDWAIGGCIRFLGQARYPVHYSMACLLIYPNPASPIYPNPAYGVLSARLITMHLTDITTTCKVPWPM